MSTPRRWWQNPTLTNLSRQASLTTSLLPAHHSVALAYDTPLQGSCVLLAAMVAHAQLLAGHMVTYTSNASVYQSSATACMRHSARL